MAAFITPPSPGDDARTLWRKVAECVDMINSVANMKVIIEGKVKMTGELSVGGGGSILKMQEKREVQN